jgi:hypothetical protein
MPCWSYVAQARSRLAPHPITSATAVKPQTTLIEGFPKQIEGKAAFS